MNRNKKMALRTVLMLLGILLISICVACYRLSEFGVDSYTGMNLGISGFLGMSFGNWQLIMNILILIVVFFTVRHCIGAGTIVNMVGVALYMTADMGISPYDSVALIIVKLTEEKVPFQIARISSDITVLIVGVVFCLAAHNNVWLIVGIGTVINSLFNGPLIQFFRSRIERAIS